MRQNVIEELGALVDTEDGTRVTFDFNPAQFQDEKSTEFAEVQIPGMSHPRLQFTNGGSRTLSFSVILHHGATDDVPKAINMLRSWLYPEYNGEQLKLAPSKLILVFGDSWPDEKWVMRSCNISRNRFDKNLSCIYAEAEIELVEFIEKSVDTRDIRKVQNKTNF